MHQRRNKSYHYETLVSAKYLFYPSKAIIRVNYDGIYEIPLLLRNLPHTWSCRGKDVRLEWNNDFRDFMICMQYQSPHARS